MSADRKQYSFTKTLLIAVDGSENSDRAIAYVADMLGNVSDLSITILRIISIPPEDYFYTSEEQSIWIQKQETAAITSVDRYIRLLIDAGIEEAALHKKIRKGVFASIAEVILEELKRCGANTLVIGRRGISKKEEFIYGSTSNKLLHAPKGATALWVIE
jgi:nucleotide-binding universal stress UspA family protein